MPTGSPTPSPSSTRGIPGRPLIWLIGGALVVAVVAVVVALVVSTNGDAQPTAQQRARGG